jgi:hypothetical protein
MAHHHDAVSKLERFFLIVGDEYRHVQFPGGSR